MQERQLNKDIDYRTESKRSAQQKNIELWRSITGRQRFKENEQYWTLMDDKSFELETIENSGLLISRSQFHGVNNNHDTYTACLKNFPGIVPYEIDWFELMDTASVCPNGGIVYLDSMVQLDDHKAAASSLFAVTLLACGPQTLVCANFCKSNPYTAKEIPLDKFIERVETSVPSSVQSVWEVVEEPFYPDKTSRTQMITCFFWREK